MENRVQLYKEKLKCVYTLLCTLRNMRLFHLKQKRLPKKTLCDLKSNPFSSRDNIGYVGNKVLTSGAKRHEPVKVLKSSR